jgi:anti-sigma B factor antagonist
MIRSVAKRGGRRKAAPAAAGHALPAELTIYRVAELRQELLAALARGVHCYDLSAVTECDSAGLQLLLSLRRSVQAAGGVCRFEPVPDPVRSIAALFDVESILCSKA